MNSRIETYFSIYPSDGILYIDFIRSPTPDEYCLAVETVAEHEFNQHRLYDLSCGVNWSVDDMKRITWHSDKTINIPLSKIAVVAQDDLTFGLFRVHGFHRDTPDHEQIVFRSRSEAESWFKEIKETGR